MTVSHMGYTNSKVDWYIHHQEISFYVTQPIQVEDAGAKLTDVVEIPSFIIVSQNWKQLPRVKYNSFCSIHGEPQSNIDPTVFDRMGAILANS